MGQYDGQRFREGTELLVPSKIRGYRAWRLGIGIDDYLPALYPIHAMGTPWTDRRRAVAYCDRTLAGHRRWAHRIYDAPAPECCCGIYATYGPSDYRTHLPKIWHWDQKPRRIIHGSIVATGRIVLGTRGFRAEYAEVEALWGYRAADVADHYGVPWSLTRRGFLKKFPPQDMWELLESENGEDGWD